MNCPRWTGQIRHGRLVTVVHFHWRPHRYLVCGVMWHHRNVTQCIPVKNPSKKKETVENILHFQLVLITKSTQDLFAPQLQKLPNLMFSSHHFRVLVSLLLDAFKSPNSGNSPVSSLHLASSLHFYKQLIRCCLYLRCCFRHTTTLTPH